MDSRADPIAVDSMAPPPWPPPGAISWIDRSWSPRTNLVVISSLIAIALACPIIVAVLLQKQEAADNAGQLYSGSSSHASNEFPNYGVMSLIPAFVCIIAVYLLFRWITRLRFDE